VRSQDQRLAQIFYTKLFAAAPHLRSLFRSEPEAQARKLMSALDAVVQNFERPTENAAMLAELGKRHVQYGAQPEHYVLVVELLVDSMQEVLKTTKDSEAIVEWQMALWLIANQMIAASESTSVATRVRST
jgi:hemoglobin-like flavoprotein